ncbi:MAG: VTT domain-containing protein [Thermoanaerobaculia bacterium]
MDQTLAFLAQYGYAVLFIFVLAEQIGLPTPAIPFLLAGGALSHQGHMDLGLAFGLCLAASLLSDVGWYEIGRRKGSKVMSFLCRISFEPDSCVRRTEGFFARYGARSLMVAKFIPGLNTAAPPLAGVFGMRRSRFLLFDSIGAVLWIGSFMALGYAFADQLELLAAEASRMGGGLLAVVLAALAAYALVKYVQRQRFLSDLRIARITPEELDRKLEAGEEIVVVDLRHSIDFEHDPRSIPGAIYLSVEEIEERHREIPRDREIVLLCT